jgi:hypothetical protein
MANRPRAIQATDRIDLQQLELVLRRPVTDRGREKNMPKGALPGRLGVLIRNGLAPLRHAVTVTRRIQAAAEIGGADSTPGEWCACEGEAPRRVGR